MTCGFVSYCGRPERHRGHHGGWRTGIRAVAAQPVVRLHDDPSIRVGTELTARDLAIVAEYLIHGSYADVSACLGIAEQTCKNHGARAMTRTGAVSISNVAYLLGWVTLPTGLGHAGAVA